MVSVGRWLPVCAIAVAAVASSCVTDMSREELANEYYNLGNGFYQLSKYDKAIQYYELALQRNPDVALARWNLALAYYQSGKYDQAEAILTEWLARDPDAIEAREVLALVYRGQGRAAEALTVLDDILTRAPENTRALNNRAVILWEMGRLSEASETLEKYLTYEPSNPAALYDLTMLSDQMGLIGRARTYAESYLSVAADTQAEADHVLAARYVLARAQESDEAYYRALEIYGEIVQKDDSQAVAWFGQAAILLTSVEDPVHGLEALGKALDKGYRDQDGLAGLLARDDLLDRPEVEQLLRDKDVYPPDSRIASARAARLTERSPAVDLPRGPWAEPGVDRPRGEVAIPSPPDAPQGP